MGNRSIKTMATKPKTNKVNPLAVITAGVVKVAEQFLTGDKLAIPVAATWAEQSKGKTPEQVKAMIEVIDEAAKATMGIVKGDDSPETAVKRAALSRALKAVGISRRGSSPKGEEVKEEAVQAVMAFVAKIETREPMQRRIIRAVYDRLLKAKKAEANK